MSNLIAVVTGAGSGIGAAIAKELAKRGNFVVVTDLNLASAKKVADEIGNADALKLDVTNPADVDKVIDQIINNHKKIDIWVSNAGISKMQKFIDISPKDLELTFKVNTFGVFYCGQAVAKKMIQLGIKGKIINTASMAAKQGRVPFLADYVASKYAVLGLTQSMAFELAPYGIRVNSICPGFVATPMQERELDWEAKLRASTPEKVKQSWINDTPLARLETPEDVAKVVAFLASEDADFITGEAISVNGGAFMD
jgi:NAD(P)-dependent dehydrogenase (short-subunit alcohol dehydrogenase family)